MKVFINDLGIVTIITGYGTKYEEHVALSKEEADELYWFLEEYVIYPPRPMTGIINTLTNEQLECLKKIV